MWTVICFFFVFFNAKTVQQSEIHHHICEVYGDNSLSDDMVQNKIRLLKNNKIMCRIIWKRVQEWLIPHAASFYEGVYKNMCLNNGGDYVKK